MNARNTPPLETRARLNARGFTIIEVALVLAIAGLIFLVVFLALPAAQKSQRDSARKQAVARVVSAIEQYYADGGTVASLNTANNAANTPLGPYIANANIGNLFSGGVMLHYNTGSGSTKVFAWGIYIDVYSGIQCSDIANGAIEVAPYKQAAAVGAQLESGNPSYNNGIAPKNGTYTCMTAG